jgi:hypothetical protein
MRAAELLKDLPEEETCPFSRMGVRLFSLRRGHRLRSIF